MEYLNNTESLMFAINQERDWVDICEGFGNISPVPKPIKVFAYFNLHKKVYSLKALEGYFKGKVINHTDNGYLLLASAKVSEAGRQRVIKEKRKNVHAGLVGYYVTEEQYKRMTSNFKQVGAQKLTYNPYKYDSFRMLAYTPSGWVNYGKYEGSLAVRLKVENKVPSATSLLLARIMNY